MNGTLYPDPNEFEHGLPPGVDPERLSMLVEQAIELRDSGITSYIDTALEKLPKPDRETYRSVLTERVPPSLKGETEQPAFFASVEELTRSLIETQDSSDSGMTPEAGFASPALGVDATIDVPDGFSASNHRVDLPPAKRRGDRDKKKDDALPERVGKFLIKGELGRGAFGVVYLGFDEELQRNVAIKVSIVADPRLQEKLRVEASKVAQVESNGIVPVYHIGTTTNGAFYIVQKYIKGSSLGDIVKQGPLSPARATRLIRDIALGLEAAHLQDILHRDLKPDNILVEENGRAWIADFGLAISESEQVTGRRELAGTLPYMSPEQIVGRIDFLDPRSDIWALGVIYYELLTGKLPFVGKSRQDLTEQICERDPRPLQQRSPGHLTETMNDIFARCCAKKPSDRFATVRELAIALDTMLAGSLSDQNIHGESMEPRFGESTIEYGTANSRFGSSRSHLESQSLRSESGRTSQSELRGSLIGPTAPWWIGLVKSAFAIVALIGLSVLANIGYQKYTASSVVKSDHVQNDGGTIPPIDKDSEIEVPIEVKPIGNDAGVIVADPKSTGNVPPIDMPPPIDADGSETKPWVVASDGTGSHRTIGEALSAGKPGCFIRLVGGLYGEALRISVPCTIIGIPRGKPNEELACEIASGDESPLTIDCPGGTVAIENIFINGKGRNRIAKFNAIDVLGGTLMIAGCDLETTSQNCVKVHRDGNVDLRNCHFVDSNEFSISTNDHGVVMVTDCVFEKSGVQLVGGTGTIERSNFYGKSGIHVSLSTAPVKVSACDFSKNSRFALAATTGGKLIARECDINGCEVGLTAGQSAAAGADNTVDGPTVELFGITIEDCPTGVQINGGSSVTLAENCIIRGGQTGIGVGTGSLAASDMTIVDASESAILATDPASNITLTNVNILRSQQSAIYLLAGNANFTDVKIEGCQYGVNWGDEDHAKGMATFGRMNNVTIKGCDGMGVVASAGKLEIAGSNFDGGMVGLSLMGPDSQALSNPAVIDVAIKRSTFSNHSKASILAQGNARVNLDEATWQSVDASGGAKNFPPAEVNVPEVIVTE